MFLLIKMSEGDSLQEHLLNIKDIREQLEAICQKMAEEDMVVITLNSLPGSYEHFIETLNITTTDIDLKFGELSNKLLQQDRWKKQFGNNSETEGSEKAFAAKAKGKGKWTRKLGPGNDEDAIKILKTITCHYSGKTVHMKKHYRKWLVDQKHNHRGSQQKAHVTKQTKEKEATFCAFMAYTQTYQSKYLLFLLIQAHLGISPIEKIGSQSLHLVHLKTQ
jgi:hypothetical protein